MKIVIVSKGNINTRVNNLLFLLKSGELVECELKNIHEIRKSKDKIVCIYNNIQLENYKADGEGYLLADAKLISITMYNPSEICDIHIYDRRLKDEIYILDKSEIIESIKEVIEEADFA